MKHQKNVFAICIATTLLSSPVLYAGVPLFSIIPTANSITAFLLPNNFVETVSYQVTNNTRYTRTLTMVPMPGITQTLGGTGACGSPFILGPQQSCSLNLVIHGSQIPQTGVKGGPVICKTQGPGNNNPDPNLCAQPATASILDISITSAGQHAYVANQLNNSVSFCQLNPATGLLSQCEVTATGLNAVEGVGFNPAGTLFYSANLGNSTISLCSLNQSTGALSNCVNAGGAGFDQPDAVAFSHDGAIFYTSNVGGSVTACLVNAATGSLSNCSNNNDATFHAPSDMTLNKAGTLAYVANRLSSTVSVCHVSGQTVNSCNDLSGSLIDHPEGITLDPSGLHAYIANAGNGTVTVCDVLQDGTGLLAHCAVTNGQFHGTGNVAFNKPNAFAYVPNQILNTIFTCQVSPIDGSLSVCLPSRGTGFSGPSGIVIN